MTGPPFRYLFGPVPSRRLGRSLGVDLVPRKTCSYDCVFCQVGTTTALTFERREYVPTEDVVGELASWFDADGEADVITLSGSGEPTLHSRFGAVIDAVHELGSVPIALLTNGSLLWMDEVREQAGRADIVKVSLSAWDDKSMGRINRPGPGLSFDRVYEGIRGFRSTYRGRFWVEVFVIPGINADRRSMRKIADAVSGLHADRIHLNTAVRPAAEPDVTAEEPARLEKSAGLFTPRAEVVAGFQGAKSVTSGRGGRVEALAMIRRRPCRAVDVAASLGMEVVEAAHLLDRLAGEGQAVRETGEDGEYFRAAEGNMQ